MDGLAYLSIKELQEKLARKELTRQEMLTYFLDRIKKHDSSFNSIIELFDQESIEKATNQNATGFLAGIPGLPKDNICQKERITSCGSKILENYSAPYDATVIARLKHAGAYLIGRANCDEFAMGSSNETSIYGPVKNPWDRSRVPGGSSGGSAAAVAAGLVPWSLGSETGGSIRQPAAFCGLVGLKTTYGLISRYGLVAYASSLDQIGPITRTVEDCAYVLSAIAGNDKNDSSSTNQEPKDYTLNLTGKIKPGLKIGVVENAMNAAGMSDEMSSALEDSLLQFKKLGANIKKINLPSTDYAAATYFIISRAEAASNLARFDGVKYGLRVQADSLSDMYLKTRHDGFGSEVRKRILVGNYVLSAGHADEYYNNAVVARQIMRAEIEKSLEDVDVLFMPVSGAPAFKFGAFGKNSIEMDLQDYFTAPANLTGLPAISVPCGFTKEKLPLGFQLMGRGFSEDLLLSTAYAFEQETQWFKEKPKID